ncbi:hypothetical protein EJ08DRAFT_348728 [Tothia fuscella]|uniref:CCR4-Not complex 3'-5'-exoribonuclease subunit Ccr4 n=1 Tax=Tothia fuscella TaxID=1048955 RepID=A0A9P4NN54_9PEZI|nr:hypothetical protein EJ08DRAFT_348728 [Tothia fuscella]
MADAYRFHGGTGSYYQQFNPRHIPGRPGSPASSGRIGAFNTDTPSPSRSPGPQSPAQYSMYNHTNAHSSQAMLNGAGHQRYNLQMGLNKPSFNSHQTHQPHTGQQQHHGEHAAHSTHPTNYVSHQHNQSGGGGLNNAANHFTPSHMQNGTPVNYNNPPKQGGDHWHKQMELHRMEREMTTTHPHARNASSASKSVLPSAGNAFNKEGEREERYRPGGWPTEQVDEEQTWSELDLGGSNLRILAAPLFKYTFLTRLHVNNNKLQHIPETIGKLRNLVHLDFSLNEISVLPPQLGMLTNLRELLLFDNLLEDLPCELGNLYQLEMLGIEGNPLNEELKSIIVEEDTATLITHLRENAPGPPDIVDRPWVVIDDTPVAEKDKFSVVTFNILCDKSATQAAFGYTPSNALNWDTRKKMILAELAERDGDVVCLQEIDQENFHNYFREALAHYGYKGIFFPRGRSKTMSEFQQRTVDGCAIFYKNSRYVVLDKQLIDFKNIAINRPDMKADHDVFNRVMIRDNIGVAIFLEDRKTGTRLIVATTHLFWDEAFRDVKLVQVAILMEEITHLAQRWANVPAVPEKDKAVFRFTNGDSLDDEDDKEVVIENPIPSMEYAKGTDIPFVLCGDFNSKPDSGVYQLITQGEIPGIHQDLGQYKYGKFTRDGMNHPFALKSAYSHIGELPFTNYTSNFRGVIDYITYSINSLGVIGLLGEVDPEYLERVPGFPNQHFPSDHLALQSEFVVKRPKEKKITQVDFGPQKGRH